MRRMVKSQPAGKESVYSPGCADGGLTYTHVLYKHWGEAQGTQLHPQPS